MTAAWLRASFRSASPHWTMAVLRRMGAVWLLLGASAFLLASFLEHCCAPQAAAPNSPAAAHDTPHDGSSHAGSTACADDSVAGKVAVAAADTRIHDGDAAPAFELPARYAIRRAVYTVNLTWPLPRPAPFHARTSRLLI